MFFRSVLLRKKKKPLHAVPRPHRVVPHERRFTCNRHPYHCAGAVTRLLRFLLLDKGGETPTAGQPVSNQCPGVRQLPPRVASQLHCFLAAVQGVPFSLEAEGPLPKDVLQELSLSLSNRAVEELVGTVLDGSLHGPMEHPVLQELWPSDLRAPYGAAIVAERQAHIQRKNRGVLEPRYEAGLYSRELIGSFLDKFYPPAVKKNASTPPQHHSLLELRWSSLIDDYTLPFADRSHLHELENLPQEIALGEIVAECCGTRAAHFLRGGSSSSSLKGPVRSIVDVGGGNGFLAAALAERLDCPGVVVDPYYPPHSVDCLPSPWKDVADRVRTARKRRSSLARITSTLKDLNWERDIGSAPPHTVVIAKHLCGSGIDECLLTLEKQGALPGVLVLAPCCFPKISLSTYCNPPFLKQHLGITSQLGFDRVGCLTDWNMSCTQFARETLIEQSTKQQGRAARKEIAREAELSFPFKRVGASHSTASLLPCMHAVSQLVELLLNHGRVLWLRDRGYDAQIVKYVPHEVTPKCKCIVAVHRGVRT